MQSQIKKFLLLLCFDMLGSTLYSIGIATFAQKADFAPGGVLGFALILYHLWGFPVGVTSLLLNLPLAALSIRALGRNSLYKTIQSMVCYTILLDGIFPYIPYYDGSSMLAALFSGIFLGMGMAIFYMHGSSSGGTDFLTLLIQSKRPKFSIGFVIMTIDVMIILLGWWVFGNFESVLYGIISTAACSIVMDWILYQIGTTKSLLIITKCGETVVAKIAYHCKRSSIAIQGFSTYSGNEKTVLICTCSNVQAYRIQKIVKSIDANAFIILTNSGGVFGEGFRE